MSAAEEDLNVQTCETCRLVKPGQSRWDALWQGTPFDDECEQTLFTGESVRSTELIVPILWACLEPVNPAYAVVAACNSRKELWGMLAARGCVQDTQYETIQGWMRDEVQREDSKTYRICERDVGPV